MSRLPARSGGDSSQPPRLAVPNSPGLEWFLREVYAKEKPTMIVGSEETLEDYLIQVGHLQKFFNEECLEQGQLGRLITILDVSDSLVTRCMAAMIKKGRSPRTCNKFCRTIRTIHRFAVEKRGHRGKLIGPEKLKEPKVEPRAWRPEQLRKLLAVAIQMPGTVGDIPAGQWHYAHLLFLLNTAARLSASLLTPSALLELDGDPPIVTIPAAAQKQDSDQVFPLVKETVEALRAIDPSRNRMIFGDWPFNRSTLRKRLKVMLVKAGLYPSIKAIPKRTELFHKLRKTIATAVKKRDGKEAATALCGHSSGFVTDFYIDKSQTGDGPDCRGALSELLVSPPPPPPEPVDRQLRLFALYYSAALSLAEPVSAALEWITAAI